MELWRQTNSFKSLTASHKACAQFLEWGEPFIDYFDAGSSPSKRPLKSSPSKRPFSAQPSKLSRTWRQERKRKELGRLIWERKES